MSRDERSPSADAKKPIGVFDSGIGGLSVVRHVLDKLPGESIVYFGDSARVPYGTKSSDAVIRFTMESARFLLHRDVKYLVIACNTASAVAMDALEKNFDIPKVGVIHPAVHHALRVTKTGRIGVLGTRATVTSGAYETSLRANRPDVQVTSQACPLLVPLAEEGWVEGGIPERIVRHYVEPVLEARVDTIILGCTHYPLLKEVIGQVAGEDVTLVESGDAAVDEMAESLRARGLLRDAGDAPSHHYYVSDIPLRFQEIGERFLGRSLDRVTRVDQVDLPWFDR